MNDPDRLLERRNLAIRRYLARQITKRLGPRARRSDILHVGDTSAFSPLPLEGTALYRIQEPKNTGGNLDFERGAPSEGPPHARNLVVIAGIDLIASWHGFEEDLDRLIADRDQIVVAMIRYGFEPLPLAGHGYLLSALLSQVPRRKYIMDIDVYPPPGMRGVPRLSRLPIADAVFHAYQRCREMLFGAPAPVGFAALIVSIRKRG